jgi:GAF domain-containing protein
MLIDAGLNFWNNHIHPEDRQRVLNSKHQMVESLQDSQIEYRMIAADGRIVWLQDIASIVVENGQAIKLRGVMVDISERQAALKEHKQVEITLQQTIEREKLLGATAQRIRQSLDLDKILNTTVTEVRQLLQADRTVIFRFETNWSGVVIVESVITPELSILDTNIYDPCFSTTYIEQYKQGRIRAIEDILKADIAQCHINLLSQFQVRSNLVVPILQGEKLWGLLIAHQCDQPRQWQPHETELLEQLATQVGIAIGQSQLYQQTQRQAQREQALNQVIQAIRTSLNLEKIFSTATEEVCKLLDYPQSFLTG